MECVMKCNCCCIRRPAIAGCECVCVECTCVCVCVSVCVCDDSVIVLSQGPLTPTKPQSKGDTLMRSIASFDVKFPTLVHTSDVSSTPASKVQTSAPVIVPSNPDMDFSLSGAWADYWETQLMDCEFLKRSYSCSAAHLATCFIIM